MGWVADVGGHDCVVCPYHGWAFDTGGVLRDVPAAESGSEFPQKPLIDAFPVEERVRRPNPTSGLFRQKAGALCTAVSHRRVLSGGGGARLACLGARHTDALCAAVSHRRVPSGGAGALPCLWRRRMDNVCAAVSHQRAWQSGLRSGARSRVHCSSVCFVSCLFVLGSARGRVQHE